MSDAYQPGLTVVTVLFRSSGVLVETLPTWVRSAADLPVRFVFVDNAPDDGCAKVIADCLDQSTYVYLADPTNAGFAGGCNRAVEAASTSHVLLLNPDVWLLDDSLAQIQTAIAETPDAPIAVGLSARDGQYVGIDLHPISLFIDRPADAVRGPLGPSGGAAVFPTRTYIRFGGFFEYMFAWGEDADLAYRIYAAGVRTRPLDLALPHRGGHSVAGSTELLQLRAFLLARNRLLVAMRTFSWPLLIIAAPIIAAAHGALAARRIRQGLLRPFLRGVVRGLREGPAARRRCRGTRFGVAALIHYVRVRSVP
jgi:N-acetylglucosaminyl-diphospho-decaprenol L-rhamnosyltransferase